MTMKKMKKVVLYTAPGCGYCIFVENFLNSKKIPFKTRDISKDKKAREEMISKSRQENVPVIEVGGEVIVGYDLKKIKAALGI